MGEVEMNAEFEADYGPPATAQRFLRDAAKLRMPEPPGETLVRGRITAVVDRLAQGRVLLLCAPAGSGKTTAVINWVRARDIPVAWLSLDRFDNDPRRFARHLVMSLEQILPGTMIHALDRIDAGADLQRRCLPALADALAEQEPSDLALVLDDYHLIETQACHQLVEALVARLPRGVHLLVTSRTRPPLELREEQVAMLDALGLAFNQAEAAELLNGSLRLGLDQTELRSVDAALAGWPAGLSLLALSQTGVDAGGRDLGKRDLGGALSALASREVADYLAEEVLDDLAPRERRFLLETSVLEKLCEPLCDAVLGETGSGRLLADLQGPGRFSVESTSGWLRMHDLVRESLRTLLARQAPDRVVTLNQRASQWFEQAGRPDEALGHAITARDGPRCGRLIREFAADWLRWSDWSWLRTVLERIPDTGPEFADGVEALHLHMRLLEGVDQRQLLPRAWELLAQHPDDVQIQAVVAPICTNQFTGDVGRGIRAAKGVLERFPPIHARPAIAMGLAGSLWSSGQLDAALATAAEILESTSALAFPIVHILGHATTSRIWADRGDAERAEFHARQAVAPIIQAGQERASVFGSVWICLGEALRLAGKLPEARIHQDFGMEMERKRAGAVGLGWAFVSEAQLALAERRPELARLSARRARAILETYPDPGAQLFTRLDDVEAILSARAAQALPGSTPTEAEMHVLTLLAAGASPRQIAEESYLAMSTVKSHLRRIYLRLGVSSRADALAVARARGLLDQTVS